MTLRGRNAQQGETADGVRYFIKGCGLRPPVSWPYEVVMLSNPMNQFIDQDALQKQKGVEMTEADLA